MRRLAVAALVLLPLCAQAQNWTTFPPQIAPGTVIPSPTITNPTITWAVGTNTASIGMTQVSGNNGTLSLSSAGTGFVNIATGVLGINSANTDNIIYDAGAGVLNIRGGSSGNDTYLSVDGPNLSIRSGSGNAALDVGTSTIHWRNVFGTTFNAAGTAGVPCTGTPTASFASVGGIVTHC